MKYLIVIFTLAQSLVLAQSTKPDLLKELNEDVWLPFIEGVNTDKAELYVNVHSQDFYWVMGGNKTRIMNFEEYDDDSRKVMQQREEKGGGSHIEVRFLERNINAEFASEKCIMKFTLSLPGKDPQTSYGVTQIFSRKENGVWKMLVQYVYMEKANEALFNQSIELQAIDKI